MQYWQAVVLGVVEGVTEFLPVSSTGHLLITQKLLGIGTQSPQDWEAANAYAVCIQSGAILAVLGLYLRRARSVLAGGLGLLGLGRGDPAGLRLGLNLIVAFIPAAVIGLLLDDKIEALLFGVWPIVASWFVGGVVILLVAHRQRRRSAPSAEPAGADDAPKPAALGVESLSLRLALLIGLAQCIAMWPGTSRSLVTIVAGLLAGLSMAAALEFSFLLGVVTLLAATLYKALLSKMSLTIEGEETQRLVTVLAMARLYGWGPMVVGLAAAAGSAWLAVKGMVAYLSRHGLEVFGWYRIAAAAVTAGLVLGGYLSATQAWD